MVAPGMRRYRVRTERQATLVGARGEGSLDLDALFGSELAGAPTRLEIGFGHGEFISELARAHPEERFIGVEHEELRVTKTAHKCLKAGATNVRLFADDARRFLRSRVQPASISRAYVLFPDPWPKAAHRRRRLLTRGFLLDLSWVAAPACRFVMASDTHEYAFQCLSNLTTLPGLWRNLYQPAGYRFDIPTRFPTLFERHKKAEGCTICYLAFERTTARAPDRVPWPVNRR
jgi:tRNA (guanine-N7-)-methyltransferase